MKSHSPRINNRSPRWKRTVINSAVVMAVSSLCAPAVYAACGADIISGPMTPCTLTALEFTVISNGGSIAVPASGVAASITVDDLATGVSIDNSGTISNEAGFSAISVAASAVGTTITNQVSGKISATSAAAIHFYGALDKRLKNEGAILSTGSTYAAGVVVEGNLNAGASITNTATGTITATAINTGTSVPAIAYGITVGSLGAGASITNSGTIAAKSIVNISGVLTSGFGYPSATGISTGSLGAGASIVNSGTITATIEETISGATVVIAVAAGISTRNLGAGASISNNDTITATGASAGPGNMKIFGIKAGDLSGGATTIENYSSINAIATAAAGTANAVGIYAASLGAGTSIVNSGTITASTKSTGVGSATAHGIEAGVLSGAVTNNLAITATATANAAGDIYAAGIYAGSLGVASMGGRGIITAQASATGVGVATARGIEIASPLGAMTSMTNNLKINATATGTSGNADSYGVYAGSMSGGAAIINGSTITAEAHVTDVGGVSTSSAYGMFADGMSDANTIMNNTNEIVVNATGTVAGLAGDRAFAYGMKTTSLNAGAVIANEGTITVSAGGAAGVASAFGIYVGTLNSTVRNSGTITATAPVATGDKAYSVFATSGSGEVINSGRMIGRVGLGGTVNMTNTGLLSIANTSGEDSSIGLNYTQSSAGVLRVGVTSASNRTQLMVTNAARFDGVANLSVEVQQGATLDPTLQIEDVVSAATLATGIFNITDNNLAWQFTAENDRASHIDLTPVNTGMTTLAAVAGSKNTAGVAAVIDAILASKPGGTSVESLYTLTSLGTAAEVATALQNFTPVLGGNAALSTVDVLRAGATNVVHEHLQDAGGLPSGDGMSDKAGWIKPFGSWAKQKDRNGELGYQADSFGLVAGRDRKISDQWSVGGALAYGKSKIDNSNGTHDVSIRTYQASAYATNHFNETNALNLQFDLGTNRNNSHRAVAGSVASADYGSRHVMLNAELERAFKMSNKTMLTPTVGVQYVNLKVGGYGESGSPSNLTVASQNQKALIISLGGTAAYKLDDEATLTAHLNFGRDIKAGQEQVTASFSNFGGSTFVTKDINPSANVIRMGVGYEIEKASGTSVVTRYDLDTKPSGYTNHMLSLNLKKLF